MDSFHATSVLSVKDYDLWFLAYAGLLYWILSDILSNVFDMNDMKDMNVQYTADISHKHTHSHTYTLLI